MKMKGILMGALVLTAIAAPSAKAGWNADPNNSTWGAASAGSAVATAVTSGVNVLVQGTPLDTDGATSVKLLWTADYPNQPVPTDPQNVSFAWSRTGNVDSVQELYGLARAKVGFYINAPNSYFSRYYVGEKSLLNGIPSGASLATNEKWENYALPFPVTYDTMTNERYINPTLNVSLFTEAEAEFWARSGNGSASATSAAATVGVIQDSMIVP